MTRYSFNGAYPEELPDTIWLSSGLPRTSQEPFTPEEIADAGGVAAPDEPEYNLETHRLKWNGTGWDVLELPQPTLADRRAEAQQLLGQRWDAAEKGGTAAMGWTVRTDAEGQSKITGGIVAFDNDPTLGTVPYELEPGVWLDLDEPTMCALGVIVAQHVKACAARARTISQAITSADTPAAMDDAETAIETGWPE